MENTLPDAPEPPHDAPHDPDDPTILWWGGLRITFRLARLLCLFALSVGTLTGCFWIILSPTTEAVNVTASNIAVAIVTAWISAMTQGNNVTHR